MIDAPIDMAAFQSAIYSWFIGATGLTTIWANQSAPAPDFPYGVLEIVAGPTPSAPHHELRYSTDLGRPAGEEIEVDAVVPCMFTVSCQAQVNMPDARDPSLNARQYISRAQSSLSLPSVSASLNAANIAYVDVPAITDLTRVIEDSFVSWTNMDVRFGTTLSLKDYIGYIDKVHFEMPDLGIDVLIDAS